jgi:acyl-CoA synthetase (AMP-forming)/AMP-acid ligase II
LNFAVPIRRTSLAAADLPALLEGDKLWTYAELWSAVARTALALRRQGLGPGLRLALGLPDGPAFLIGYLASAAVGCVPVPIKSEFGPAECASILSSARPHALLFDPESLAKLNDVDPGSARKVLPDSLISFRGPQADFRPVDAALSAPAAIHYSYYFGEGHPFGAVLTHGNFTRGVLGYIDFHGINGRDRTLVSLPMAHVFTLVGAMLATLYQGGTIVVASSPRPRSLLEAISSQRITQFPCVPQVFESLARFHNPAEFDLSSIRHLTSGADLLTAERQEWIERTLGVPVIQGYGLTECLLVLCNPPGARNRPGTLGVAGSPRVRVRIVDDRGTPLPRHAEGEIEVQSPSVMAGYFDAPDATARVLRNGWLRTGDLGSIDEAGYVSFHRLRKSILNVYGNKVDPVEVCRVIAELPGVVTSEVTAGCTDSGETKLRARVRTVERAPLSAREIRAHCRSRLARYKVPGEVELVTRADAALQPI